MKPLFFIFRKSFINTIKKLLKRPIRLTIYIIIFLFFIALIVMSIILPSSSGEIADIAYFEMFVTIALFLLFYFQLKHGIKKGSTFFRQADVHYLFVSPISPKKILTYGLIKQMYMTMLGLLFLIIQFPNLKRLYNITLQGALILLLTIFGFIFFSTLLSLDIYTFTSKSIKRRKVATKLLDLVAVILFSGYIYYYFQNYSIIKAFENMASSAFINYFPIVGAFKSAIMYSIVPADFGLLINIIIIALYIIGALIALYFLNPDYYEDVLDATIIKEKQVAARKNRKTINNIDSKKIRKVDSGFTAFGAKAIFQRHLLEYRKNKLFFIDRITLMLMVLVFFASKIIPDIDIKTILLMTVYFLFFYSLQQGKWIEEINKHYIYLIPDKSFKKVFYGMLAEIIKNTIDACFTFILLGILLKADILTVILCILSYSTYAMVFLYADVVSMRLFGKSHGKVLKSVIKIIVMIIVITPGNVLSAMIEYGLISVGAYAYYISYLPIILSNVVVIFAFMMIGKRIFEISELE